MARCTGIAALLLAVAAGALAALLAHARGLSGGPVWLDENTAPWLGVAGLDASAVLEFTLNGITAPENRTPAAAWAPIPAVAQAASAAFGEERLQAVHLVGYLAHALAALALVALARGLGAREPPRTPLAVLCAAVPRLPTAMIDLPDCANGQDGGRPGPEGASK